MDGKRGGANYTGDIFIPIDNICCDADKKGYFFKDTEFIKRTQLYNVWLWKKFVNQFRIYGVDDLRWHTSRDGWRCEYWGKMMRGACLVYQSSKDDTLYRILADTVNDLLSVADKDGRISTYSREYEFNGWDMWGRKYVLLGLQYFLEICEDRGLSDKIVTTMRRHADYIIDHIGKEEDGKKCINKTSRFWGGLNSSSILEPYVRLYNITGEDKYLAFAEYIVSEGGCDRENIFEAAYKDEKAPYQYAYTKAYEMMSCFEGLIEYARVTHNERYKKAAINFGYKLLKTDVTVIGCSGCTHELFDNSARLQTRSVDENVMQETCVTVTWMKLCSQLLRLTGDVVFAEAMEQSFCNAYLGSLNTHEVVKPLYKISPDPSDDRKYPYYSMMTFDSYSPLTADIRGRNVGGNCVFMEDNTYYGCCACIGSAGIGLVGRNSVMENDGGLTVQYYVGGRTSLMTSYGKSAVLNVTTEYPYSGRIKIKLEKWDEGIGTLSLRIPAWSKNSSVTVDGIDISAECGYLTLKDVSEDSEIVLEFDMRIREILPPYSDGPNADIYVAYAYGPVLLAKDARLGDNFDECVAAEKDADGYVKYTFAERSFDEIRDARIYAEIYSNSGKITRLIDYSSAGKTLDERSRCAVWIRK